MGKTMVRAASRVFDHRDQDANPVQYNGGHVYMYSGTQVESVLSSPYHYRTQYF